jgi:hypothetical protein
MSIFDRVKGVFGRGGSGDYIGDLGDDSWGEVPQASPATYLTPTPQRAIEEILPRFEDDWAVMLREARVREQREEHLIRVPVSVPEAVAATIPAAAPETDWDALLADAKARAERAAAPAPAPAPAPPVAKASSAPTPSKFAMGTMPPTSTSKPAAAAAPARASAFLPSPRAPKRDDEWESVITRAKARAQAGNPTESIDPWEDAIRKAKTHGAA